VGKNKTERRRTRNPKYRGAFEVDTSIFRFWVHLKLCLRQPEKA
jgi:hypothetical protein